MTKKKWYSVAEFAERVNRSRQYINKLTNNGKLQEFTRIRNHVKLINKQALELFDQEDVNKVTEVYTEKGENTDDFQREIIEILRDTINNLERELQEKNRQLQMKDEQIEKLNQSVENFHAAESEMRQLLLLEKKERLQLDEREPESSETQEKKKKAWWRFK